MQSNRYVGLCATIAALTLFMFVIACGGEPAEPAAAPEPTAEVVETATAAATATASAPATSAATAAAAATTAPPATEAMAAPTESPTEAMAMDSGLTVFTLGEGTVARYKVEEVLANTGFKIATGETSDVAGSITFDADGAVVADESRIAVQAATLQTDSDRRDGYVRNRTLETDTYPEVVFQPTSIDGLPESLADASGPVEFTITGDLTVKDQTRELTWDAMADFAGDGTVSGFASVDFTFDDFGMTKPSVAIVLSVEDTILLELDLAGSIMLQ